MTNWVHFEHDYDNNGGSIVQQHHSQFGQHFGRLDGTHVVATELVPHSVEHRVGNGACLVLAAVLHAADGKLTTGLSRAACSVADVVVQQFS